MKKKILAVAIAAIMLLTAVASISLAYLTDTDKQDNVFTIGNVKIQQIEYERVKDKNGNKTSELKLFSNNQKVYPAVYGLSTDPARSNLTVNGSTISIRNFPNYVDKMVTVGNIGNSEAYVRVIVAVPVIPNEDASDGDVSENWLHTNFVSDTDTTVNNGWYYGNNTDRGEWPTLEGTDKPDYSKHYIIPSVEINGKLYDLTVITNIKKLAPSQETAPCLTGFYLDNSLNCDEGGWFMPMADGSKCYVIDATENMVAENLILVATQAVQCEGFTDAWQAFAASFGEITETNHPWYVAPVEQ